ncbi:MAG: Iron-containing redox enzyme [Candidatus Parcubacteria bacterium]|jgi:hypothetical protein
MKLLERHAVEATDEDRRFLLSLIQEASERFLRENPVLKKIQRGELSEAQWRDFAIQRYLAALPFERLLIAGMEAAEQEGYEELASVIRTNLHDETGTDDAGVKHEEMAHGTWRHDFYTRLGISDADLETAHVGAGTERYASVSEALAKNGDPFAIAGALLVLEATIPSEFRQIKDGRDKTFRDAFVERDDDDAQTRNEKAKARLYLDDHIHHDATSHFPDLLIALERIAKDISIKERIKDGAHQITDAKAAFYNDLTHQLNESE